MVSVLVFVFLGFLVLVGALFVYLVSICLCLEDGCHWGVWLFGFSGLGFWLIWCLSIWVLEDGGCLGVYLFWSQGTIGLVIILNEQFTESRT